MSRTRTRIALAWIGAEAVATVGWALWHFRAERRAGRAPFRPLRRVVNERINPLLVGRGAVGGRRSDLGLLEHVGRRSGVRYQTPVYPGFRGGNVWIPAPYGESSQWVQNVRAARGCHLAVHDSDYQLDAPTIVSPTESPTVPKVAGKVGEWLGVRYLRLHVASASARRADRTGDVRPLERAA